MQDSKPVCVDGHHMCDRESERARDRVETVGDGQSALDLLKRASDHFHLVIADVATPVLDGSQVLQAIREDPRIKDLPLIIMATREQTQLAYQCLRNGADDYFLKPIRMELVNGVWQNVWRKRKEKKVLAMLDEERLKRKQMEELIGELQDRVTLAVETPIHLITRTVAGLLQNDSMSEEARSALAGIMNSLKSSNLYQPAFEKVLTAWEVDAETKSWLTNEVFRDARELGTLEKQPLGRSESGVSLSGTSTEAVNIVTRRATTAGMPELQVDGEETWLTSEGLGRWDFDVWSFGEDDLVRNVLGMFVDLDLVQHFQIPWGNLVSLVRSIRSGYLKNPYHNFRHGFDVAQACYLFLTTTKARDHFTPLETLGLILAALVHDIEHPGVNNVFHINTESPLALRYNDQSILENFHCYRAFCVFKKPENNIFVNMPTGSYKQLRHYIIACVLATDVARHMDILSRFNATIPSFNKDNARDRELLLEILIKCGDVSNPMRPFHLAKYWSDMIQEENFLQGDQEKKLGIPSSPFMDRENPQQAKMSVSFIDFIVAPLFRSVSKVVPAIEECLPALAATREYWHTILLEKEKQKTEVLLGPIVGPAP
eukprot:Opistho-2@3215